MKTLISFFALALSWLPSVHAGDPEVQMFEISQTVIAVRRCMSPPTFFRPESGLDVLPFRGMEYNPSEGKRCHLTGAGGWGRIRLRLERLELKGLRATREGCRRSPARASAPRPFETTRAFSSLDTTDASSLHRARTTARPRVPAVPIRVSRHATRPELYLWTVSLKRGK